MATGGLAYLAKHKAGAIIIIEVIVIVFIGITIINKKSRSAVLDAVTTSPIRKEYLIFPEQSALKYFYELKPASVQTEHPDWLPYEATYTFNADGLNERYDYPITKPADTFRIITLGDSFTFGHYVNTKDNWTEKLEDDLNASCKSSMKYEVINLGVYGYDMQYSLERYRLRGAKYQPDFVIWLLLGERMNELMRPTIDTLERTMTEVEKNRARKKGDYSPEWTAALQQMMQQYTPKQRLEQERAFMLSFDALYKGPLLFMVPPAVGFDYKARIKLHSAERPDTYFTSQLPDLSLSGGLLPDGHPNTSGHASYAHFLRTYLSRMKLIPCTPNVN